MPRSRSYTRLPQSPRPARRALLQVFLGAGCLIGNSTLFQSSNILAGEPAAKMFPESTQTLLSLPDTPRFVSQWNKTQLGQLASDSLLKKFWESQRAELQTRLSDAGWQLNLQIEDIQNISTGQSSIGWISRTGTKAYSIGLVVDIGPESEKAQQFLDKLTDKLKERNATQKKWKSGDVEVVQFLVPSPADPKKMMESHYAISKEQLLATDDAATMSELIAAQSGDKKDSLANSELYKNVQSKIGGDASPEVEYFIRPIGMAKLLRSISGKPPKNQSDILKLLDEQGFDAIQCAAGNVQLSEDAFDVFHHGFVMMPKPVKEAVQILDFPNSPKLVPPPWINSNSASIIGLSWNLKDAFPKFKYLVDGVAGENTFDGVMEGIRDDIQGPQIDIYKEVLPYLSNEFFIVTEIDRPITTNSKLSLVFLKLNDPTNKLKNVIKRYGENESSGKELECGEYRIWSFNNKDQMDDVKIELELGGPKPKNKNSTNVETEQEEADEEPLLDQWAISIVDGYFVFGSDAELLIRTIERIKESKEKSVFEQPDVARAASVIEAIAGDSSCITQINRSDRSFEMQYELFRAGKLNASKSVLAAILDRILDPKHKNRDAEQKLKGDDLPPFSEIQNYFMPSGSVVRTEEDGWSIQSFVLGKE